MNLKGNETNAPGRVDTTWVVAAVCLLAVLAAWLIRFVQDDAFISFVYARSFVAGDGLAWFGHRVQGYTNFLWVMWITLGLRVGLDPVTWAHLGSLLSFVAVLYGILRLARLLFSDPIVGLLAVLLFATNYTNLAYATGGMETMLQTALLVWALIQAHRVRELTSLGASAMRPALALASLVSAAVLTRPDSAAPAGLILLAAMVWARSKGDTRTSARTSARSSTRSSSRPSSRSSKGPAGSEEAVRADNGSPVDPGPPWRVWAALVLPIAMVLGAWLAWTVTYYGDALPNTYHAKVGGASLHRNGLAFCWRYLHWYLLWPWFLLGGAAEVVRRVRSRPGRTGPEDRGPDRRWLRPGQGLGWIVLTSLIWVGYVVAVGGDFMEFRFFVPIAPFLSILLAYLIYYPLGRALLLRPRTVAAIALLILAASSVRHAGTFRGVSEDRVLDSIHALGTFYGTYRNGDWDRLGGRLGSDLAGSGAVLATRAVGAIPFYSGLETVDLWGLNDRQVAKHGNPAPAGYLRPGHRRHASLDYLRRRGVHLILGHPTPVLRGELDNPAGDAALAQWVSRVIQFNDEPIREATLVVMPVDESSGLLMWYLTPDPRVDAAISSHGWERRVLSLNS